MIWGVIWIGGRSDVFIMNRDEDAPHQGYTQYSYIEVLNDQLPTIFNPGMVFMQDNAPIHTAHKVKAWFVDNVIPVIAWPPYSPDMNPIEIIWVILKRDLNVKHPELLQIGASNADYQYLYNCIQEAWEAIPQEKIDSLIKSMDTRNEALRLAERWHTRF